ncbi:MerR-family transcriptional regulator [[Actinomadura] parvosata subsp. kistnae]|uniref:HTH merR-type domain-containing protein n=1 Tax=[Actinomadura] parvosata subsp. kistnae TaxID=1909395 RepID=A0A1V0A5F4_9ACTN|nr:MerR family transcriptional regulator [Nonomuraea sp. ATCC 55076]AQZ65437.1 hypothetical protein BKM31_31825 [Nonomuraea sp. ATCC 55076]SPL96774.1 MerR-family transcriptional regulator [Actinomadura parvosata subsp. kistnae]
MLIGELARETGTTPRALRFYEEQGLLTSERTPAGYRVYGPDAARRVRNIRDLLTSGFTVEDVQSFLPHLDGDLPPVICYHPSCEADYEVAERRLAALDERIATLTRLRDQVAARMPWLDRARRPAGERAEPHAHRPADDRAEAHAHRPAGA